MAASRNIQIGQTFTRRYHLYDGDGLPIILSAVRLIEARYSPAAWPPHEPRFVFRVGSGLTLHAEAGVNVVDLTFTVADVTQVADLYAGQFFLRDANNVEYYTNGPTFRVR